MSTIVEEKKVVETVVELPPSPNAETDKRVTEVLNDKKKRKHPVEARIAELTAKNAKLEEERKKDREELEAKVSAQNEKNIAAELDRRKAEAAANDKRPERTEGQSEADFTQKMAEWVIRQQDKITPKVNTTTVAKVDAPAIDPQAAAYRKEEFDGFLDNGRKFITRNPDFNETLQKAAERGLTLDNQAMVAIIKLKAPEVAYYLAKPENDAVARRLMTLDGFQQQLEVAKIAERLAVNPNDFVSSAGRVGIHLTGGAQTDVRPDAMDTDDYLRKRKQDIKSGLRRR
jgi:hypothetical protein